MHPNGLTIKDTEDHTTYVENARRLQRYMATKEKNIVIR